MHVGRWLLPTEHQLIHTNQYMNIFSSTTDINRRLCLQNNEYVYLALTKKGIAGLLSSSHGGGSGPVFTQCGGEGIVALKSKQSQ